MKPYSVILRFRADPSPASPSTGMRRVMVRATSISQAIAKAVAGYTGPWYVRATVIRGKQA
jgi:hypothetical protein